jgi:hypothetical protein
MTTTKALIAKVKFAADLEIECLKLPDGSYGIGVSQITSVFSLPKNHATREVKALLGKDISLPQTTSELNSKKVNFVTLQQFVSVCRALDKKGNVIAGRLIEIHLEASFTSIVAGGFNDKFTQDDLAEQVELRMVHKKTFPLMTRWFHLDGVTNYGLEVNRFKRSAGLPIKSVDLYSKYELFEANASEHYYDKMRTRGMSHLEALDHV